MSSDGAHLGVSDVAGDKGLFLFRNDDVSVAFFCTFGYLNEIHAF